MPPAITEWKKKMKINADTGSHYARKGPLPNRIIAPNKIANTRYPLSFPSRDSVCSASCVGGRHKRTVFVDVLLIIEADSFSPFSLAFVTTDGFRSVT